MFDDDVARAVLDVLFSMTIEIFFGNVTVLELTIFFGRSFVFVRRVFAALLKQGLLWLKESDSRIMIEKIIRKFIIKKQQIYKK